MRTRGQPVVPKSRPQKPRLPGAAEYQDALQHPHLALVDPELASGRIDTNALGLPSPISGQFGSVYRLRLPTKSYALKVFTTLQPDRAKRYEAISRALEQAGSQRFVAFRYADDGIRVQLGRHPLVSMEWVDGATLSAKLPSAVGTPNLRRMIDDWIALCEELTALGIAHGDLQHGNALWTAGGFRLVDYDGMFVPALQGLAASELGHRHYQHPGRTPQDFGPHVDHFAAWCLHGSLLAIAEQPELWRRFGGDEDRLLFSRSDLEAPRKSALFAALRASPSSTVRTLAARLENFLGLPPRLVPPLSRAELAKAVRIPPAAPAWVATTAVPKSNAPKPSTAPLPDWIRSHFAAPPPAAPPPPPIAPPRRAPQRCSCGRPVTRPKLTRGSRCGRCHAKANRGLCRNKVRHGRSRCAVHS